MQQDAHTDDLVVGDLDVLVLVGLQQRRDDIVARMPSLLFDQLVEVRETRERARIGMAQHFFGLVWLLDLDRRERPILIVVEAVEWHADHLTDHDPWKPHREVVEQIELVTTTQLVQ